MLVLPASVEAILVDVPKYFLKKRLRGFSKLGLFTRMCHSVLFSAKTDCSIEYSVNDSGLLSCS